MEFLYFSCKHHSHFLLSFPPVAELLACRDSGFNNYIHHDWSLYPQRQSTERNVQGKSLFLSLNLNQRQEKHLFPLKTKSLWWNYNELFNELLSALSHFHFISFSTPSCHYCNVSGFEFLFFIIILSGHTMMFVLFKSA